jgi:hypothetical protein
MRIIGLFCVVLLTPGLGTTADLTGKWELTRSELTYKVTHPLHKVVGKSTAAKGKGACGEKGCEFLVAVPVKTFDSGDGNRDSHMWQTVKAGLHPMVEVVLAKVRAKGNEPKEVLVDAEVTFAGKKAAFKDLELEVVEWKKEGVRLKGILNLSLKSFDIKAPSLLTVPVEDQVPVEMDLTWTKR